MEREGEHSVCILTRNEAIPVLDNVVIATVCKHIWGLRSEVQLNLGGVPRECAISLDNLRTVPKALQVEPITMLGPKRIDELCRALAAASVC